MDVLVSYSEMCFGLRQGASEESLRPCESIWHSIRAHHSAGTTWSNTLWFQRVQSHGMHMRFVDSRSLSLSQEIRILHQVLIFWVVFFWMWDKNTSESRQCAKRVAYRLMTRRILPWLIFLKWSLLLIAMLKCKSLCLFMVCIVVRFIAIATFDVCLAKCDFIIT